MADITMCAGDKCKMKDKCYRYTATANSMRQSYFMVTPYVNDIDASGTLIQKCEEFWPNDTAK